MHVVSGPTPPSKARWLWPAGPGHLQTALPHCASKGHGFRAGPWLHKRKMPGHREARACGGEDKAGLDRKMPGARFGHRAGLLPVPDPAEG